MLGSTIPFHRTFRTPATTSFLSVLLISQSFLSEIAAKTPQTLLKRCEQRPSLQPSQHSSEFVLIYNITSSSASVWEVKEAEHGRELYSWTEPYFHDRDISSPLEISLFCELGIQKLHTSVCNSAKCDYRTLIHKQHPGVEFAEDEMRTFQV